ncbi:MAG TPA: hypothetical protein VNJ01_07335 [Bacteriovoracaceae bacterium]|nr:hypothetical protein [Bacteriovoracaceae bacterium]
MITIFAIFDERTALDRAVTALKAHEFTESDLSVLLLSDKGSSLLTGVSLGDGLLVGASAMPMAGLGSLLAAGPLMAAQTGGGIGGTVGGVKQALTDSGVHRGLADHYERLVKEGGILISVRASDDDRSALASGLLESSGARDISTTSEEEQQEFYPANQSQLNNLKGSFPEV